MKCHLIICPQLSEQRQIMRDDMSDTRVTAGGLLISHKHDHLAVRKELDSTKIDGRGNEFLWVRKRDRLAGKAKTHAVRVFRNRKILIQKKLLTSFAQRFKLGSGDDANRRKRAVSWDKTVRDPEAHLCLFAFYLFLEFYPVARFQLS